MQNWTKVLGVKCIYCHTWGAFEKEDIPAKQTTREMLGLVSALNKQTLPAMKNLVERKPLVTCYTCHRGQIKPETAPPMPSPSPLLAPSPTPK